MADKRDQFSIMCRFDRKHPRGIWIIVQAVWRNFEKQDGGYWGHEGGKEVFHFPAKEGDLREPDEVRAEYERLIEYDPNYDPAGPVNVVELMQDEDSDCAFDQPCRFGHRVDGHAVYCHNSKWLYAPRKCRRTWYTGGEIRDEDCEGFQANPNYKPETTN